MANNGKGGMPRGIRTVIFWSLGLGVIALILIVLLILFGNLSGNLGISQDNERYFNETINLTASGNIPSSADNRVHGNLANVVMTNITSGEIITSPNYTISGVTISNATDEFGDEDVNVTYTVNFDGQTELDAESIISNYSTSAANTSAQFPTTGTILGIAILLIVLIGILIFAVRRLMEVTNSMGSTGKGSSSSNFGGSSSSNFG